jgi:organic hydroperoxide reductase OsmC/OhrA
MTKMSVALRSVPGTGAVTGWAGSHTVVVDRPVGRAGGTGLGFNGGELLALAIGGCMCNDLRYVADAAGVRLASVAVEVTLTLAGEPLLATGAETMVSVQTEDPQVDVADLIERAAANSTVSNSIARGVPVRVSAQNERGMSNTFSAT